MLYVAAGLMILLALGHSIIGERRLIPALAAREDLPRLYGTTRFTGATIRFAWHVTSLLGLALAALVLEIALGAGQAVMVATVGVSLLVTGLLPLLFTRARHLSWVVLFAAGAVCLVAAALG